MIDTSKIEAQTIPPFHHIRDIHHIHLVEAYHTKVLPLRLNTRGIQFYEQLHPQHAYSHYRNIHSLSSTSREPYVFACSLPVLSKRYKYILSSLCLNLP